MSSYNNSQKKNRRVGRIRNKKSLIDRLASWVWLGCSVVTKSVSKKSYNTQSGVRNLQSTDGAQQSKNNVTKHLDLSLQTEHNHTEPDRVTETVAHNYISVQTTSKKPEKTAPQKDNSPEVTVVINKDKREKTFWPSIVQMAQQAQLLGLKRDYSVFRTLFKSNTGILGKRFDLPFNPRLSKITLDTSKNPIATFWSFLVTGVLLGWNYLVTGIEYSTNLVSKIFHNRHKKQQAQEHIQPARQPVNPTNTLVLNDSSKAQTLKYMIKKRIPKKPKTIMKKNVGGFWLWRWVKNIALGSVVVGFIASGIFFIWVATLEIPDSNIDDLVVNQSTKIFDATGEVLLYDVFKDERRTVVGLDQISPNMQKAILATEDDEFYSHNGYDVSAILRGVCYEISRFAQVDTFGGTCPRGGGSTITQQVIKNTLLNADRKLERKVKEVVLARKLEKQKTKDEILEIYLNEIAFGGPVYGVEQASLSLFGKKASELSIAESAYLAALPKAPTTYLNDRARFDGRQKFILGRMQSQKFITDAEYKLAVAEEVEFRERVDKGIKAPHFVFYVLGEIDKKLTTDEEALNLGGYKIQTTLDWELQQGLEEVVARQSERISSQYGASNLAVVAIENKTGKVRAMVGSKDYFADDIDGKYNIATALRQPGSTFKPFVYANAFSKGYTPSTILWDTKTEFSTSCYPDGSPQLVQYSDRCYSPQNYDKSQRGPVSMRNALAQSLNIPAVKALYLVGIGDSMKMAQSLGINSLTRSPNFYGLNLVLGGGEVQLLEMANAYGTFANGGERQAIASWETIIDSKGQGVDEYESINEQVLSSNVAAMINDVLSDNNAKRPVFGSNSALYYGSKDVAVKTGTTNNYKDVWTIGYSSDITIAVWAGNNDNTPLTSRAPSSSVVGPFWREAMDVALKTYDAKSFANYSLGDTSGFPPVLLGKYEGGAVVYIDPETGEIIPDPTEEELAANIYQRVGASSYHSILHYVNKSNPRSGAPSNPSGDPLYDHFEYGVQNWVQAKGWSQTVSTSTINDLIDEINEIQGEGSNEDTEDDSVTPFNFSITSPTAGATVAPDDRVLIEIETQGKVTDIESIYYYFNNSFLESGNYRTTSIRVKPESVRDLDTQNTIKVIVQKVDGTRIEKTVQLTVNQ